MVLAIPLVFFIGGFLGWLYGRWSGRKELIELRKIKLNSQSRTDKLKNKLRGSLGEFPKPKAANTSVTDTVSQNISVNPTSSDVSSNQSSSPASSSTDVNGISCESAGYQSLDELYKVAGRVKPLEYDLTQRQIQVRALKQSLRDVKRINEKQLVSVRLQAENKANLQNEERLADKQSQIDSLRNKLSELSTIETTNLKLQKLVKQLPELVRECSQLREKQILVEQKSKDVALCNAQQLQELDSSKKRLVGTLENLSQSESRVAELQKEAKGLNQQINSRSTELKQVRLELAKAKKVEAQLEKEHDKSVKDKQMKADFDRLESVSNELEQSRVEIENLSQSLECAELAATGARQNDIEVRRLRSEMQSLQSVHDNSARKVKSLEKQIAEQERQIVNSNQLKERVRELESVEAENLRRDRQITELKTRLREIGNDSGVKPNVSEQQPGNTRSSAPLTPLYVAPKEKDDLKKINGIGPVMEKMLNSLGITSFKQVAEFKPEDISTVTKAIEAFPGRIERDNWVGGAKEQYAKKSLKANT